MTPYNLWLPPFDSTSGGIRVLYGLLGWLLAKGQIVLTNSKGPGNITIYPEIVNGNPFESDKVVRYILATPGVMGSNGIPGPTTFPEDDKKYYFSRLYGGDDTNTLFLPILDLHTFKITNKGKRTKKCKLIGKGQDLRLKETEGLFEITRPFASNQQALADYLNECEVMYSYDPNSAMFEISRLCGCRVVIIPSFYTKDEFSKYEPGMNGISYGLGESEPLDAVAFRLHYMLMRKEFEFRLERMIDETQ